MVVIGISKKLNRDALLVETLKEYYDIHSLAYENCVLKKYPSGKPYLEGSALKVSISHSGEYLAIAVAPYEIGIDIQKTREIDYQKIAKRYGFSARDLKEFYDKYTISECEVKRLGTPLPLVLKNADHNSGITYHQIPSYTLSLTPKSEIKVIER